MHRNTLLQKQPIANQLQEILFMSCRKPEQTAGIVTLNFTSRLEILWQC